MVTKLRRSDTAALRREAVHMMAIAPLAASVDDWKAAASIASGAVMVLDVADRGSAGTLDVDEVARAWKLASPKYRESRIATHDWAHQHHRSHAFVASVLSGYVQASTGPVVRQRSVDASRYTDDLGRRIRRDVAAAIAVAVTLEGQGDVSESVVSLRCPHSRRVRDDLRSAGIVDAMWSKASRTWTLDPRSAHGLRSCTEEQVDTMVYVLVRRGWTAAKRKDTQP